jgi:hypothetical protein
MACEINEYSAAYGFILHHDRYYRCYGDALFTLAIALISIIFINFEVKKPKL